MDHTLIVYNLRAGLGSSAGVIRCMRAEDPLSIVYAIRRTWKSHGHDIVLLQAQLRVELL